MALMAAAACGDGNDDSTTGPSSTDPKDRYVGGTWLTRDIAKPSDGWDVVFKYDNSFEASVPARPEVKILGPYSIDAAGNVTGTFTANMGGRVGKIEAHLESSDTILYFKFIETNAFNNPNAVNGVISTENRGPNPTKPNTPASKPPTGGSGTIDPAKVTWLRIDAGSFTPNPAATVTVTSISNPSKPSICWNSSNPARWPADPSGQTVGNLYVILNIGGVWYGTPIEWLLSNQGPSACTTMENIPPQPPFIQGKAEPIASYVPKSGEKVGFMISSLPMAWGGRGPYERGPISETTWP